MLIGKFTHKGTGGKGANVLDIGCGKGGDLNKWRQAKITLYVALGEFENGYNPVETDTADIADMSIAQAKERYATMRNPSFDAHFYAHDCYAVSVPLHTLAVS